MQKIPVIQPVKDCKEFKSIDEFNIYFNDHRDEFDKETTCKLNKKYKIPGFRITKIQGVVQLKNVPESRKTALEKVGEAGERILKLETKVNSIVQLMNDIVDKCNLTFEEIKNLRKKYDEIENEIENIKSIPTPSHVIPDPDPEPEPEPKVSLKDMKEKFDNNGPNPTKRNAPARKPGQMMESALAWLQG